MWTTVRAEVPVDPRLCVALEALRFVWGHLLCKHTGAAWFCRLQESRR